MHFWVLAVTLVAAAMTTHVTLARKTYDPDGRNTIYRLEVTQDVAIESGHGNHNGLPYLLVGKHPQFPNKRSLLKFEDLPRSCRSIRWAKMYMYFVYAHKASWHTTQQTPYLTRQLLVHRVLRPWNERRANRDISYGNVRWSKPYLGLNNVDAQRSPQSSGTTMFSYRPRGFVEFDVTRAVRDWSRPGVPNHGVLVKVKQEAREGRGLRFASNADRDPKHHAFVHVYCNRSPIVRPWPPRCRIIKGRRICLRPPV